MDQHYYDILELNGNATVAQIKAAYRANAKKYHPDVCTMPNAKAKFIQINEAYQYLLDQKSGLHTLKYESEDEFYKEKEQVFNEWLKKRQAETQARAQYYAEQDFEEFTNSEFFKELSITFFKKVSGFIAASIIMFAIIVIGFLIDFRLGALIAALFLPGVAFIMTYYEHRRNN